MKRIARSAIVECSAEAFYALVEDIEAYPSFLPWCAATQVRERSPERTVATLTLAAKGLRQSFTTENTNQPGRAIDMRLVEGPFRHFGGHWRFTPLSPEAAKVEFALEYAFSSRVIAALLDPVFSLIADSTVTAFVRRMEERKRG
jgi:ribosome-associated toxin RatA of RatAB toxin-antitoxin module